MLSRSLLILHFAQRIQCPQVSVAAPRSKDIDRNGDSTSESGRFKGKTSKGHQQAMINKVIRVRNIFPGRQSTLDIAALASTNPCHLYKLQKRAEEPNHRVI